MSTSTVHQGVCDERPSEFGRLEEAEIATQRLLTIGEVAASLGGSAKHGSLTT